MKNTCTHPNLNPPDDWNRRAPADQEIIDEFICETGRFVPGRFRINVRPDRRPKWSRRGLRREQADNH